MITGIDLSWYSTQVNSLV